MKFQHIFCYLLLTLIISPALQIDVCPDFDLKHPSYNTCDNIRLRCPINYQCIEGKFCCINPVYLTMAMGGVLDNGGFNRFGTPRPGGRPFNTPRPFDRTSKKPYQTSKKPYVTARVPNYDNFDALNSPVLPGGGPGGPGTFRPFVRQLVLDTIDTLKTIEAPIKKEDFEKGTVGDKGLIKFLEDFLTSFVEKKLSGHENKSKTGDVEQKPVEKLIESNVQNEGVLEIGDETQTTGELLSTTASPASTAAFNTEPSSTTTTTTPPPTTTITQTKTITTTASTTPTSSTISTSLVTQSPPPTQFPSGDISFIEFPNKPVTDGVRLENLELDQSELLEILREAITVKADGCPPADYSGPDAPFTGFFLSCTQDGQCPGRQKCCPSLEGAGFGTCRSAIQIPNGLEFFRKLLRKAKL